MHERVVKTGLPLKNKGVIFTRDCEDTLTSIHCTTTFFPTSLCGVLVFDSVPVPPPSRLLLLLLRPLFDTHNFVTHHLSHTTLSHNTLSHTIFHTHNFVTHTTLSHTPSFTHNFVTHHFSTLPHTIFHTQLCHTPFFNFVTHHLSHTTLSFGVASVALVALGWLWWRACSPLVAVGRPGRRATLRTSTFVSRGRRGTWRHLPAFGVAGVALVALGHLAAIDLPFAWQAWHFATSTCIWRGSRGIWRHLPAFGVAGVALRDIYLRLAWHTWQLLHLHNFHTHTLFLTQLCNTLFFTHHLSHTPTFTHNFVTHFLLHPTLSHTIFHTPFCHTPSFTHNFVTHSFTHTSFTHTVLNTQLCHTPSFTYNFVTHHLSHTTLSHTTLSFGVAGVALVALGWLWWRALVAVGRPGRRATLRGRRGIHLRSLWDIYLRLAWQAWHLLHLAAIDLPFAWQAWHLATSTCVWQGRRGTCCTWLPWTFHVRGRRGTWWHWRSICVAGVAFGDIYLRLAWYAWHLLHLHNFHTFSFTHNFATLSFTHRLSHTIFHTLFVGHSLSHTTFTQTVFHTQLCHTPAFLSHTIFHTQLCHTQLFTYNNFYFSILHHLLCLSFLPCPATTFGTHYWKKLGLPWVTLVKLI